MKDPCRECDNLEKRNLFFEQSGSSLLDETDSQYPMVLGQSFTESREDNLKYKHLFETAPDAVFIADAESGLILDANESAAKLLGIPIDEILGMHQTQLHPPKETERYKKIFMERIKQRSTVFFDDIYVCHKDGQKIPVQINSTVTQIGSKKIIYGIFRDITEQQRLSRNLASSEARFKRLAEAAFEAIVIHEQGKTIDANQQYLDMFGYTLDEIKSIPGIQTIASQSRALVKEKMASKYEGVYDAFGMKKDGTIFPVQIHAKEAVQDGRNVRIAAIRNMTEQKTLKKNLQQSERKYKALYDKAPVALFRTGLDGMLLNCNKACLLFFGLSQDEPQENYLNRINVGEHYVDPERHVAFIKTLTQNKRVKHFEAELRKADGSTFWVSISAEIFPEAGYIEGAMYDITVKKCLTKTEHLVLEILLKGKSNKQIARQLRRSVRTVEDHRARIMHKLGVDNLVDLTRKVLDQNHYYSM